MFSSHPVLFSNTIQEAKDYGRNSITRSLQNSMLTSVLDKSVNEINETFDSKLTTSLILPKNSEEFSGEDQSIIYSGPLIYYRWLLSNLKYYGVIKYFQSDLKLLLYLNNDTSVYSAVYSLNDYETPVPYKVFITIMF